MAAGAAGAAAIILIAVFYAYDAGGPTEATANSLAPGLESDVFPTDYSSVTVTDGQKHTVPLDKIISGGPPPDGIPSIDDPKFARAGEAEFMSDSDVVIGLEIGGEAKAYPLRILVWHEIVNDVVGGVPVAVTYCPLCYTSQVFERTLGERVVEFGTSGKLYNSNLVMYDRATGTYWSQALGAAIKGELAGQRLGTIPFDVIRWDDWRGIHQDTVVLTTETGHVRAYDVDPYGGYYTDYNIIFPVDNAGASPDAMHPKEVILGFENDNTYKAYRQVDAEDSGAINDAVGGLPVLVVSEFEESARAFERPVVDGQLLEFEYEGATLADVQTGSVWDYGGLAVSGPLEGRSMERLALSPGFWFEWIAFHPDTEVYEP